MLLLLLLLWLVVENNGREVGTDAMSLSEKGIVGGMGWLVAVDDCRYIRQTQARDVLQVIRVHR